MKRPFLCSALILLTSIALKAQTNTFPSTGNAGVGTTTPNYKFETVATDAGTSITYPLSVVHLTTGTATDGFGTGISFGTQNYSGTPITSGSISLYHGTTNTTKMTFSTIYGYNNFVDAMTLYNGNVGIGTTSPLSGGTAAAWLTLNGNTNYGGGIISSIAGTAKGYYYYDGSTGSLAVQGASNVDVTLQPGGLTRLIAKSNGNVGIGTTSPVSILNVVANETTDPQYQSGLRIDDNATSPGVALLAGVNSTGNAGYIQTVQPNVSWTTRSLSLQPNGGNVGIGTTDPGSYKLAVNGTIHSKAVIIDLVGWPDYVFKKDYKLMPLAQVKSYIDQNQHLPGLPTDKEVESKGLDVGEMNKLLTKKVEELTLYLIEKDKKEKEQDKLIKKMEQRLSALEKQ